jgi:hypothetical protein
MSSSTYLLAGQVSSWSGSGSSPGCGSPAVGGSSWDPVDRDEVIVIGIQRGEFRLPIAASDQPDLADIGRFYRAGGRGGFGSRATASQWWGPRTIHRF